MVGDDAAAARERDFLVAGFRNVWWRAERTRRNRRSRLRLGGSGHGHDRGGTHRRGRHAAVERYHAGCAHHVVLRDAATVTTASDHAEVDALLARELANRRRTTALRFDRGDWSGSRLRYSH